MKKTPNLLWIVAIALGWLFDFLFWKKPAGINFVIFTVLCLVGGFFLLIRNEKHAARGTLWLIPLILFFDAVTFIRAEPLTVFLAVLLTLFLMVVFAMTYLGGHWFMYGLLDYVSGIFKLISSMIARPLAFNAEVKREQAESGATAPKRNLWPVVRGIIIALPILAIFAALLASADVIFGQQLDALIKLFRLENLPEYIFRFIYILVGAYLLAGVFLHAATQSSDGKFIGEVKPLIGQLLGFTETAIVLGSVTVLFAAFVFIQFRYFFGGQSNIHIDGYTYSEYARRGFGELVAVAVFSLLMILGLGAITRRENEAQRRAFSGLSVAIVALVAIMLVSAYQRLNLYEAAYGFSRLRTYTHVALIWIGLLLGAVVVLEIMRRERAFALAMLIASLGFSASLPLLNVDSFIARQNINLAVRGKQELDTAYLGSLSEDVVPTLAQTLQAPTMSASVREAVGAALACLRVMQSDNSNQPWQGFHFSHFNANQAFSSLKTELDKFTYDDSGWPYKVTSSGGKDYPCSGGFMD